jgi:hypothetical protein
MTEMLKSVFDLLGSVGRAVTSLLQHVDKGLQSGSSLDEIHVPLLEHVRTTANTLLVAIALVDRSSKLVLLQKFSLHWAY